MFGRGLRVIVLLALAGGLTAAGAAAAPAGEEGFRLDGDAERGAPLFAKWCKLCHGPEGRGDGPRASTLDPAPGDLTDGRRMARWSDEGLFRLIRDGGEAAGLSRKMPGWSKLASDQQLRDLAAFVRTLAGGPEKSEKEERAGEPEEN